MARTEERRAFLSSSCEESRVNERPQFSHLERWLYPEMITTHASSILFPDKDSSACFSVQVDDPVPGPSLNKVHDDQISALKMASMISSFDSDLDVNALEE
ncbi:hypothetical protein Q3G72_014607 [Acer saccharum]|nr:hypothetical protein Q3G72_014607 [Acer saccharum]